MNGEPKPILWLCLACLAVLAYGAYRWLTLTEAERFTALQGIAVQEAAHTPPPLALWAQPRWLWQHRLPRLRSLSGVLGLGLLVGLVEGSDWRRRDSLGGFRPALWAGGLLLGVLLGWMGVAYLVAPWPLPLSLVGSVGCGLTGLVGLVLGGGRLYTP